MANPILMAGLQIAQGAVNNWLGEMRENRAVQRDYYLSERAADKAAQRQGEMYERFFSPEALMKQYNAAGLSPGLMMGGAPGSSMGGSSAPQGGAAMQPSTFMPIDVLGQITQLENIKASTKKTEAETEKIKEDTKGSELQNKWQEMINNEKFQTWNIFTKNYTKLDEQGINRPYSLTDLALDSEDWETFREATKQLGLGYSQNEIEALKQIYTNSLRLGKDISVIQGEKGNAEFNLKVLEALDKKDFADNNAESIVQYLKQNVETNKLTEEQKKAWNDLLEEVGKRSKTAKQILLIIGMMIDKAMSEYRLPGVNINNNYRTSETNNNNYNL